MHYSGKINEKNNVQPEITETVKKMVVLTGEIIIAEDPGKS
jgi:hypothetical protein